MTFFFEMKYTRIPQINQIDKSFLILLIIHDFNQIDPVCAIRLFRSLNHACQV
jgi:hypothetical protein